ncbi:MAG: Fic family protein, partial [Rikenellaceae bacterium]
YTKIEYVEKDMEVTRFTASRILDKISSSGILTKVKKGNSNYYLNYDLIAIFAAGAKHNLSPIDVIESITSNEQ